MDQEFGARTEEEEGFNLTAQEISTLYPSPHREFLFSGNSGSIYDHRFSKGREKIGVPTDCGVVASKEQELMTTNVVGCAALYLEGANSNMFFHLTPNSRLGYRYFRYRNAEELARASSGKVSASLPEDEDRANVQGVIVINIGSENGGDFDYRKIRADAERFVEYLKHEGFGNIKVVEVPLDSTTVYATPKKPGKVFVCGTETSVNSEGRLDSRGNRTKSFWVDTDPKKNIEYVTHNPFEKAA